MLYLNKRTSFKDWMRYLGEHNFKHSLQNICMCNIDVKSHLHFFLHFHLFFQKKRILLSVLEGIDNELLDYSDFHLRKILLFDDVSLDVNINSTTVNPTINVLISSKRFEEPSFETADFLVKTVIIFTRFCSVSFFRLY